MINRIVFLVLALVGLAACGGEAPSEPGTLLIGPEPGQVCVHEGQFGGLCASFTCPNGDAVTPELVCLHGRWTCDNDVRRCATTPSTCDERSRPTRCDSAVLGYCPGTQVPVQGTANCLDGRWQCQADFVHCPSVETDAGHPADAQVSTDVSDAGADATATDADADAEPRLSCSISYDGPPSYGFAPGTRDARMIQFRLQCSEAVELRELPVTLEARTTDERIVSMNRQLVASNVRLINAQNGESLLGPLALRSEDVTSNLGAVAGRLEGGVARFEANHLYYLAIAVTLPERVDPELFGRSFRVRIGENGRFFTNRSLYRVERGTYYAENPSNGFVPQVEGNLMWIEQPRVSVSIHPALPALQTVTRNARAIQAMSVSFNNLSTAAIRPVGVTYTVAADLGYGYRTQNGPRALLACTHACGGTGAVGPYGLNTEGRIGFSSFAPPIVARGAAHCTLTCATDSVVEGRDGDRFAVGIADSSSVAFEDEFGNRAIVDLDDRLQRQLSAPTHTVTVVYNGMLAISANPVPNVDLVGTEYGWVRVASYNLNLAYEDATLRRVGVRVAGNARCVREIQVRTPTAIVGRGTIPQGMTTTDIETFDPPLGLGTTELTIEARLNPTVDPQVDPSGCRVGDTVAFALNYGDTSWGPGFETATNLLAVGTVSGTYLTYAGRPGVGTTVFFR